MLLSLCNKTKMMKTQKIFYKSTEINKIAFSEIESYLEEKGHDVMKAFMLLADENEFVYVSNGFVRGLTRTENEAGEYHHYFIKDGKDYTANKYLFS